MKFSTTSIILAAALSVSAHPSHVHKRAHNSVEARNEFVVANKPVASAPAASAPAASPTSAVAAAASSAAPASSGGQGTGPSTYTPFCSGNSKRATVAEIAYKGNVGGSGQYGCNLMAVQSSIASKYQYTVTFTNAGEDNSCKCWNKIGPDGGINGFFNGNEALSFDLAAGAEQVIAVDANSQFGCSCGKNGPELTNIGQFAGTWVEGDVGNLSNAGWSGFDASSLVAAAAGMDIPGLSVCGAGTCSIINPGGTGTNAFVAGTAAMDGLGLNLPAGPAAIKVIVNYGA
jgi:hypothetical protein